MLKKISKEKCKHKNWSFVTNDKGNRAGVAICTKCDLWMTHSDALQYKNLLYQTGFQKRVNIITLLIALGAISISIWIANISPKWQLEQEINNEIVSLYRNIIANEEILIANDYREFVKNPSITNLPEPYINYQMSGKVHEILQRRFGIINYRYLLYYLNQISLLDDLRERLSTELILSGTKSTPFKDLLKMYSELSIEFGESEGWEKKFNVIHETECLLYLFQKTFDFIVVDERDKTVSCSNVSLNRIFYHFGYLPGNAPNWFEKELQEAVKQMRGIDI